MKIAHECPVSIFKEVSEKTDYSYALVHLFEERKDYYNLFKDELRQGREVILDNSIFELGTAFDPAKYAYWIEKLQPTWYIIPDALENANATIFQAKDWMSKYKNLPGKTIGVIQGKDYSELKNVYVMMNEYINVDMIAISFDYTYYEKSVPHTNKYYSWMIGRTKLICDLLNDGIINVNKPHHLLGCALPQEGIAYRSGFDFLYSMDTSNPVVHGMKGIKYERIGLSSKESQKLFELIDAEVSEPSLHLIKDNIDAFRYFWTNGK